MKKSITFSEAAVTEKEGKEKVKPSTLENFMNQKLGQRSQLQKQAYEQSGVPLRPTLKRDSASPAGAPQFGLSGTVPPSEMGVGGFSPSASVRRHAGPSLNGTATGLGGGGGGAGGFAGLSAAAPSLTVYGAAGPGVGLARPIQTVTGASVQDLMTNPIKFNDETRKRALGFIQDMEGEYRDKAQTEFATRVEIEKQELLKRLWPSELDVNKSKAGRIVEKKVDALAKQHVRRRMQLETEYLKLTQLGLKQVIEEEAAFLRKEIGAQLQEEARLREDARAAEEAARQAQQQQALMGSRKSSIYARLSWKGNEPDTPRTTGIGLGTASASRPASAAAAAAAAAASHVSEDGSEYTLEKVDWLDQQAGKELEWLDQTGTGLLSEDMRKLDEKFLDVLMRTGAAVTYADQEELDKKAERRVDQEEMFYEGKNRLRPQKSISKARQKGLASRELVNVMLMAVKQAVTGEKDAAQQQKEELEERAGAIEEAGGEEETTAASWLPRAQRNREEMEVAVKKELEEAAYREADDGSYEALGMRRRPETLEQKFSGLIQMANTSSSKKLDIAKRLSRWTSDAVNRVSARGGSVVGLQTQKSHKKTAIRTAGEFFMVACKESKAIPSAKLAIQLDNQIVDMTSTFLDDRNSLAFSEVLSRGLCLNLRSLRLSHASLSDEAAASIIRASKILPIKELVLRGNKIGIETAAELALALNPGNREIRKVLLMMNTPAVDLVPSNVLRASMEASTSRSASGGRPSTALNVERTVRTRIMSAQAYRPISREMERFSCVLTGRPGESTHHLAWTRRDAKGNRPGTAIGLMGPGAHLNHAKGLDGTTPPGTAPLPLRMSGPSNSVAHVLLSQPTAAANTLYEAAQHAAALTWDHAQRDAQLDIATRWHKTLRDLDISNNPGIGDKGAALILRSLGSSMDGDGHHQAPSRLIVSASTTMDNHLLAPAAVGEEETIPRLEVILMEACGVGDAVAPELGNVLASNRNLITLNLGWNLLRGGAAHAIAHAIAEGSKVQDLDLSHNGLGDAGVAEILWALHKGMEPDTDILNHKGHLHVGRLALRSTKMGPRSAVALSALIPQVKRWGDLNQVEFAPDHYKLNLDISEAFVGGFAGQCLLRSIQKFDVDFRVGTEQYNRLSNVPSATPTTELSLSLLARGQHYKREDRYEKERLMFRPARSRKNLEATTTVHEGPRPISLSLRAETFSSAHLEAQKEAPLVAGPPKKKGGKGKGGKKGKGKEEDAKAAAKQRAGPPPEPPKPGFGQVGFYLHLDMTKYHDRQALMMLLEHDEESNFQGFYNVSWNNKTYREKGLDVPQGRYKTFHDFYTGAGWLDPEKGLPPKGTLEVDVLMVPYESAGWRAADEAVLARLKKEVED